VVATFAAVFAPGLILVSLFGLRSPSLTVDQRYA
jgi:hypothetical protein